VSDLQNDVAAAADRAGAHSTAPALLLQSQAALGRLAASADAATEGGRRPYRITEDWAGRLGDLAHVIYLLADQTGVQLEAEVRAVSQRMASATEAAEAAEAQAADDEDEDDQHSWI
jgi:hypothetical protein